MTTYQPEDAGFQTSTVEEAPPTPQKRNPYVGPRTFTENDKDIFFGRDREARDLLALVQSERLVLFYAQSGAGKSSLINTRLVPGLRDEGFEVLPVTRVSGELSADIEPNDVKNIFIYNLILSLNEKLLPNQRQSPKALTRITLANFLAGEADEPANDDETYYYEILPHLLIVDQFEEIVTTHLDRWRERDEFFNQLTQAMQRHQGLWVVLSMREDHVPSLDPYIYLLPNRLRTRFHMQRMGRRAALQAITEPAKMGNLPFAEGVAETLVDNLRQIRVHGQDQPQPGQFVEPVQLQVVCYQLWKNIQAKDQPSTTITWQDLAVFGNVDTTLAQFYHQAVKGTVQQVSASKSWFRTFFDASETRIRTWFGKELITEADTRGLVYRGPEKTGGLNNDVVDLLANQYYLLRAETRAGGVWYELTHDRFVVPILKSNARWRASRNRKWGLIVAGIAALIAIFVLGIAARQSFQSNQDAAVAAATAEAERSTATAQVEIQATEAAQSTAAAATAIKVEATNQAITKERIRPIRPGLSIGGESGIGTLGYFVVDEAGQTYILSSKNVLGDTEGKDILQPARLDGGRAGEDVVAFLSQSMPTENSEISVSHLAALAQVKPDEKIQPAISEIGEIRGIIELDEIKVILEQSQTLPVQKVGRTTGRTEGDVKSAGINVRLPDGKLLQNAIVISIEASPGDEGALVVDDQNNAVGVLVALSDKNQDAYVAPIGEILGQFNVQLLELRPDYSKSDYIYGLFDQGGEDLMIDGNEAKGWVVISEAIGADPTEETGRDYSNLAGQGLGVIIVLNHAYGEAGTLPASERCEDFAQRAANFVKNSPGAHIWVIGNEMNFFREQPRIPGSNEPEIITPRRYADCFTVVRHAIKNLPGHSEDEVIAGAPALWNNNTTYEADPEGKYPANPNGDWVQYLRDILLAIGPNECDGISIHTYSHGYDPALVTSTATMNAPFQNRHYNFYAYRDQLEAIPPAFRHLPVYLTEMNGDREEHAPDPTWPYGNNGWIKNAYKEINAWNTAGNQQIRAAVLYRWQQDPLGWGIDGKPEVQQDFLEAIAQNYKWDPDVKPSIPNPTPPTSTASATPTPTSTPTLTPTPVTNTPTAVPQLPSANLGTARFFGLNIDPLNPEGDPELTELEELGVELVRFAYYDPSDGDELDPDRLAFYAEKTRSYANAEINSLIILNWDTYINRPAPDASDEDWDNYIEGFAKRCEQIAATLAPWQPAFQVWYEPDIPSVPGYVPTLRQAVYGRMLTKCYNAIKTVDPNLTVVSASLGNGNPGWLAEVVELLNGNLPADVIGVNLYGQRPEPDWPTPNWAFGYAGDLIDGYYQAGGNKPVWLTEIGVKESDLGNDREQVAEFLTRYYNTITTTYSDKVENVSWFAYSDGMVPSYGLLDLNGNQKPAYQAYRQVTNVQITPSPAAATPTLTPTLELISCGFNPQENFVDPWERYKNQLGCPLQSETAFGNVGQQSFEGGKIFWWADQDSNSVYDVVISNTNRSAERVADSNIPDATCTEIDPLLSGGIARLWCARPDIQQNLGNPTGNFKGDGIALQEFENGFIWRDNNERIFYIFPAENPNNYIKVEY